MQQITQTEVTVAAFGPTQNFAPQAASSQRIKMDNLGSDVLKAVYRNDWLHLVMDDGRDWFQDGRILSSIRLVRLNVAAYPSVPTTADSGFIDRVFGSNNPITDQPSDHTHYGWPAVEVNRYGDMVIVYARSGATIFPEARISLFSAPESDIHPSRLLKAGEVAYGLEYSGVVSDAECCPSRSSSVIR